MTTLPTPTFVALDALDAYANHYRFGCGGPRVVYWGGAVSRAVYEERRRTAPTMIADVFEAARTRSGVVDVDLVVCPCPISTDGDDESWITAHHAALTTTLGAPSSLAPVGYSAGARYALLHAVLEDAAGVACLGGAGVGATLVELEPVLRTRATPLRCMHLMNAGDPLGLAGLSWVKGLGTLVSFETQTAPGQHPFVDYIANGLAQRAFEHALAVL